MRISWFRTHIRLTVTVASIMLLLATTFTVFAGHLSFIHAAVPPTAEKQGSIWAGNEAVEVDPVRGEYTTAYMQFTVPTITGSPGDHVSVWAGLGGDENATTPVQLVQAGVGSAIDGNGNQVNTPWWQVWPYNAEQAMPMGTIHAGDTISVTVSSNWLGSDADVFALTDETTNDPYTYTLKGDAGLSDSATAECIVELPSLSVNGSPISEHLPDFNPPSNMLTIDNCSVATNANDSETGIGNVAHYNMSMWDGSTELAAPGAMSDDGNSFPVYWYNSGA